MLRRARFEELERNVEAREGRDGWLFLSNDSNDVIAQHTGAFVPDRDWERRWSRVLRGRRRRLGRLGAEWVFLVVPDREGVYADKLPPQISPATRRPVHRLLELADSAGVEISYPLAELAAARAAGDSVYAQTDTHWNAPGAYLAYRLVCEQLQRRGVKIPVLDRDEVDWIEQEFVGDLGVKLDPPRRGTRTLARPRAPRARLLADNEIRVTGRRLVFESDRDQAPACVFFGTSYAVWTLPFLAESCRRLVYVHTTGFDLETLRAERPEVVITMTAERGLRRPPRDRGASKMLAEVEQDKRAKGVVAPPGELDHIGLPPRAS